MTEPKLPQVQLTEYLYQRSSALHYPLSGTFELSPVCNFACRMCYIRKTQREVDASPRPIFTLADWRRIAAEAREAGMLFLLLTGGEPLLWPDFWTLYEELIHMGFLISINTNGSLIDEEAVARFRALPPRRINITLYGAGDESYHRLCGVGGVYGRVDRAIRGLRAAGVPVKLNCSLTPLNAPDLETMVAYARDLGLTLDATAYMFPPVRRDEGQIGVNEARFTPEEAAGYRLEIYRLQSGEAAYRQLLRDILDGYTEPPGLDEGCVDPLDGRIRCRAGKASFWITWDGYMTPCGLMNRPRVDLRQTTFAGAWEEIVRRSAAMTLSGACEKCSNCGVCHPCAAMALAETGSPEGIPTYLCRTVQEMERIARETLEQL